MSIIFQNIFWLGYLMRNFILIYFIKKNINCPVLFCCKCIFSKNAKNTENMVTRFQIISTEITSRIAQKRVYLIELYFGDRLVG